MSEAQQHEGQPTAEEYSICGWPAASWLLPEWVSCVRPLPHSVVEQWAEGGKKLV
jgi:hypothetical protein